MISDSGDNLIFVIGQPRSGTTLVAQMLNGFTGIHYPSELWLALPVANMLSTLPLLHQNSSSEVLTAIARSENFTESESDELCAGYLVNAYNRVLARAEGCSMLVDKTPRYYGIIPTLIRLLPNARFLLISRNPLDVAASHKTTWGLDIASLATPEGIEDATFDLFCAPALIAAARDTYPGERICWVSYEDIVRNPEEAARGLSEFVGVEYADSVYGRDKHSVSSEQQSASLLGDKKVLEHSSIHSRSIDSWKRELSQQEAELVCSIVGEEEFHRLGYELPFPVATDQSQKDFLKNAFIARQYGSLASGVSAGAPGEVRALRDNIVRSDQLLRESREKLEEEKRREAEIRSEAESLTEQIGELRIEYEQSRNEVTELRATEEKLVDTEARLLQAQHDLESLNTLWPWMNAVREADASAPRISIITPSFNQAEWIEETILSILAQNYPDFEHIVVDGGSTDGTSEVVARYPHVRFVSEPDQGQTHAINKGILLSTGEIVAYLNSDDLYRPGCFARVSEILSGADSPKLLIGGCDYIDGSGEIIGRMKAQLDSYWDLQRYWGWERWYCIPQQSVFWKREVMSVVGLFDVRHQYTMDYEMWLRMTRHFPPAIVDATLAAFRLHATSKTIAEIDSLHIDHRAAARRHWPSYWRPSRWYLECVSLTYTSAMLVNIAEDLALDKGLRKRPLVLIGKAIGYCPLMVVDPRVTLTVLTILTRGSFVRKPIEVVHRAYRVVQWRVVRKLLKKENDSMAV